MLLRVSTSASRPPSLAGVARVTQGAVLPDNPAGSPTRLAARWVHETLNQVVEVGLGVRIASRSPRERLLREPRYGDPAADPAAEDRVRGWEDFSNDTLTGGVAHSVVGG
jgi:hypothetical protein